jgi:hypothetical protein
MRLKLIACKVLSRELSYLAAHSDNIIDITYIRQGYHNEPDKMRAFLQCEIDSVEGGQDGHTNQGGDFDAILLAYGLCSNGIAGLRSSKYPIIVPRGHDCLTFFLGSKERYRSYFDSRAGVYWYTRGWLENGHLPNPETVESKRAEYEAAGYDEDAVDYLMEVENSWIKNYSTAAYITVPDIDSPQSEEYARRAASGFGWRFDRLEGNFSLLSDFLEGHWDNSRFLTVPPGQIIAPSYDAGIIKSIAED